MTRNSQLFNKEFLASLKNGERKKKNLKCFVTNPETKMVC